MRGTVILWDVDGTLISAAGVGRRALTQAFDELYGRGDALASVDLRGATDRQVFGSALSAIGRPDDAREREVAVGRYLAHLTELLRGAPATPLPGVLDTLDRLAGRSDVLLGLGTGNVRRGAELKLASAGLLDRFRFGGFGDDHASRADLLGAGVRAARAELAGRWRELSVLVVGDTPKDVEAAHAVGARALAIATGGHDSAELTRAGAERVLGSLTEPHAWEWLSAELG